MTMLYATLLAAACCCLVSLQAAAESPLNPMQQPLLKAEGYRMGSPTATTVLQMFGDPLCPDCSDLWTSALQYVVQHYAKNPNFAFVYTPHPLALHHNAHLSVMALCVADYLKPGSFSDGLHAIYAVQDSFSTQATMNNTTAQVVDMFATVLSTRLGLNKKDFLVQFSTNPAHDMLARAYTKLGAARGVWGTPTVFLNGVELLWGAGAQPWELQQWIAVIGSVM